MNTNSRSRNNNKSLNSISQLVNKLDSLLPAKRAPRRSQKKNNGTRKAFIDPKVRGAPDNLLSLTRSQFTATSPQNYWEFIPASTPGGLRVRGRELIGSAALSGASTGAFQLLNVTDAVGTSTITFLSPISFPRLSSIASAFDFYKFKQAGLMFNSNQPTTQTGEIILAVNYDSEASAPTSSSIMMRNITAVMANIYSDASCCAEGSLSRLPRYLTTDIVGEEQNYQGAIFLGIEGYTGAAAAVVGYLVIQYDVEFFAPQ